jgi:hypothetical protein
VNNVVFGDFGEVPALVDMGPFDTASCNFLIGLRNKKAR